MNQDNWREIIQFLEPIDVFSSLLAISKSIHAIILESVVLFSDIDNESYRITFRSNRNVNDHHHDDELTEFNNQENNSDENNEFVRLLGNVRYFINLHLLKLGLKYGKLDPALNSINDDYQLKLLEFYRKRLLKKVHPIDIDPLNNYVLRYITVGNIGIGKSSYHNILRNGKFEYHKNMGIDFAIKTISLPNQLVIKHQIWDTSGEERFHRSLFAYVTKSSLLKRLNMIVHCFAMNNEKSFNDLNQYFEEISKLDKSEFNSRTVEVIIGLHSYYGREDCLKSIDAIKKAYSFQKSVFVQVNSEKMLNIYTLQWYLQLKYAYFNDLSNLTYTFKKKEEEKNETFKCSLQ